MTESTSGVNLAQLTNVGLARNALDAVAHRAPQLPGLLCLYGPAGWGKTSAAAYCANRYSALYVAARSIWTKKAFLLAVLREMGVKPAATISEMADQCGERLSREGQMLIIDEVDHLVANNHIELVRDLFEASLCPILLVGEEQLPAKLKRWERFHSRVLKWVPAQPVTLEDAQHLRRLYTPGLQIKDDLLQRVVALAHGSVRRVAVNLALIQDYAATKGLAKIGLQEWGERELYTGEAPARRLG